MLPWALFKAFRKLFGLKGTTLGILIKLKNFITQMKKFYLSEVHWNVYENFYVTIVAEKVAKNSCNLLGGLYERNWFTFALKIFLFITWHKKVPRSWANWKRTGNRLPLFLYILEAKFIIDTFWMFYVRIYFIQYCSSPKPVWLYEIFSPFMTHLSDLAKWTSSARWNSLDSYNSKWKNGLILVRSRSELMLSNNRPFHMIHIGLSICFWGIQIVEYLYLLMWKHDNLSPLLNTSKRNDIF